MLSFWKSVTESGSRIWNYLFFVGLGLGLLAKGPIVLILCIPPLVVWAFVYKRVKKAFKVFPWIWGTLLMLVISLPWYYIAEKRSPGFIDYFIVGEHFKRFFYSGWTGDKYGFPKTQPIGIVWLFLLGGAFPWIILAVQKLLKYARTVLLEPWLGFLLMWLVWTPLFFTVSSSLIHTYVLPVMAPVALLTLWFWEKVKRKWLWLSLSMIIPVAALIMLLAGLYGENLERYSRSDKYLIENHSEFEKYPLYYFNKKSYSSQFYSSGRVKSISAEQLASYLQSNQSFDIIIKNKRIRKLEEKDIAKMTILGSNNHNTYFRYGLK
jgi:4-amino-4-deoxy-L-arabinose transferase-like glycosyltransferase